jgi:hypothetical protein
MSCLALASLFTSGETPRVPGTCRVTNGANDHLPITKSGCVVRVKLVGDSALLLTSKRFGADHANLDTRFN